MGDPVDTKALTAHAVVAASTTTRSVYADLQPAMGAPEVAVATGAIQNILGGSTAAISHDGNNELVTPTLPANVLDQMRGISKNGIS